MPTGITILLVGAGSSYTPELIDGLLSRPADQYPVREIRMQDPNAERRGIMAGLAERMIAASGREITVRQGAELVPLLAGVDFVITQIRVGGMDARYLDESIPMKYGCLGQETTGAGGMFKALRTIPPMLEIARAVEREAPQAFILNYTNPSGIITEAVCRHTGARFVGLCAGIPGIQAKAAELLQDRFGEVRSYCVGLNHLGFIHRFVAGEQDITAAALARLLELTSQDDEHAGLCAPEYIRVFNAVPIMYLPYYLHRRQKLAEWQAKGQTRAQEIMEIERSIFAEAADPATTSKPEALTKRGGGGYANVTFPMLHAILHDTGEEIACTVPNRGTVADLPAEACVEVVCRTGREGPAPLPVGEIPLAYRGLVQAVKAYETLTVEAAVTQSRDRVIEALVNHPLVGDLDTIEPMVDELLAAHGLEYH
ncbi:MAG TPA: 6-phospho-beta-glucosidase [Armatimonadota bacterium]|jgi:6-phospho-beta-glucosidase